MVVHSYCEQWYHFENNLGLARSPNGEPSRVAGAGVSLASRLPVAPPAVSKHCWRELEALTSARENRPPDLIFSWSIDSILREGTLCAGSPTPLLVKSTINYLLTGQCMWFGQWIYFWTANWHIEVVMWYHIRWTMVTLFVRSFTLWVLILYTVIQRCYFDCVLKCCDRIACLEL